jgi:hypothetical protein
MAVRLVTARKTITTAISWQSVARLSAGGSFSFTMPAASAEAAYLGVLQRLDCFADALLVASGYIKDWEIQGDTLSVRGDDMAFELAGTIISAASTGLVSANAAVTWLGTKLPAGWTLNNLVTGSSIVYLSEVVRESILATLGAICTAGGLWYVIDGFTLTVSDAYGAIRAGVVVAQVTKRVDSNDITNRIFPYGAGSKEVGVNLRASTMTVTGYTVDKAQNSITDDGSIYPVRERDAQFNKIAPRVATEAALIDASNALVLAGVEYLRKYATPIQSFSVDCYVESKIMPLERVALNFVTDALLVNETPVVTEATLSVSVQGVVTTRLTLESDARRIPTDAQVVAASIVQGHNANLYPTPTAANDAPSTSAHVTHSNEETALVWSLGETLIQLTTATLTGSLTNTGALPGMSPTALQYRLNGAGSWLNLAGTVDLLGVLAKPGSGFPLAKAGTINLRATGVAELIKKVGSSWLNVVTIPNGTKVQLQATTTIYSVQGTQASEVIYGTLPAGTVVSILGSALNTIPYATNKGARWYQISSPVGTYLKMYVYDTNTLVILEAVVGETSIFDATIAASLTLAGVKI